MKKKNLFSLVGSICLVLVLVALLIPGCAEEAPPGAAPGLEKELTASKAQIAKLEKEIASLKAPAKPEKPIELKLSLHQSETHTYGKIWVEYAPKLEAITDGRVKLKVYYSQTLAKGPAGWDACQREITDLAHPWMGYQAKTIPLLALDGQLFLWSDAKGIIDTFKDPAFLRLFEEDYAAHGLDNVVPVAGTYWGIRYIATTKKELKVPTDLKGLKMRVGSPPEVALCEKGGGSGVFTGSAEAYEALERGIVDGIFSPLVGYVARKWDEPCQYFLNMPLCGNGGQLIASKKGLAKIPDDLRPAVIDYFKHVMDVQSLNTLAAEERWRADLSVEPEPYMKFYTPTSAEKALWMSYKDVILADWLKEAGERGQKALEILEKYN